MPGSEQRLTPLKVGGLQQRDSEDGVSAKKARVVWSVEMHQQFVQAVNQLGIDSAHAPARVLSWRAAVLLLAC